MTNLENLIYKGITNTCIDLTNFGQDNFQLGQSSVKGYVGVAAQDTITLLVGLQNIIADMLEKPRLRLNLDPIISMNENHQFLTAMKAIHRYFFMSIQSGIEAASEKLCKNELGKNLKHDKAFYKALSCLTPDKQNQWKAFFEGLKVVRNECSHPSNGEIHAGSISKLNAAELDFLIKENHWAINCTKYKSVFIRAAQCITDLEKGLSSFHQPQTPPSN